MYLYKVSNIKNGGLGGYLFALEIICAQVEVVTYSLPVSLKTSTFATVKIESSPLAVVCSLAYIQV